MYLINEGFQSGSAERLITKIISVVERKIGKAIFFSSVPIQYTNQYGRFSGFFGSVGGNLVFRLNFLLSSSDSLYSIDLFDYSDKPTITVDLYTFNIVQAIEAIAEELSSSSINTTIQEVADKRKDYTTTERKQMLFDSWIKEDDSALELLQTKRIPIVYTFFLKKDKYNADVNLASFTQLAKTYLFGLGLTNPTFRARKKGSPEKEVVDKALEDQFLDIVDNMSWIEKFEFLKGSVTQMYKGLVNSIYVYGNPETGKSYEVMSTLDKLGADYKLYKGNVIKGKDDLIRILYNNREDRILVFDDADNVLTVDPNIWKTVLENTKVRTLTYVDTKRRNNKDMNDIPPKFDFTSGVIFISNVPKLNSAIASRSIVMNVKLSNDEALAKVESSLKNFLPNIDMKTKREALDYAKEISNGIKNMGYRTVETIIIAMQISPSNWKKQAIWLLSSR